ncbi:flagellar biosynthesis anti-sigma factor FlgM [Thauera sinica]|uniref:Negative regulator of flagellin synthesis n=1 Tax=Thauera sinica TaxID=2665146 RepID=A0ABW1AP93_9RHOO|nr:flagellar biosynthesis anti-sigma factor FlgM [Thauera sp. K11]ATE59404.1 flagellar biosynthesis anti-sigma factor FlgM [Thauera sp. K11]
MKIENTGKPVAAGSANEARNRPAVAGQNVPATVATASDKVELSSLSSSLQKAEAAMAETPVIDQKKVDEIRQAIADGRFKVDADRVADGLIASVREMLGRQG